MNAQLLWWRAADFHFHYDVSKKIIKSVVKEMNFVIFIDFLQWHKSKELHMNSKTTINRKQ